MFEIPSKFNDVRFGKKEKLSLVIGSVRSHKLRSSEIKNQKQFSSLRLSKVDKFKRFPAKFNSSKFGILHTGLLSWDVFHSQFECDRSRCVKLNASLSNIMVIFWFWERSSVFTVVLEIKFVEKYVRLLFIRLNNFSVFGKEGRRDSNSVLFRPTFSNLRWVKFNRFPKLFFIASPSKGRLWRERFTSSTNFEKSPFWIKWMLWSLTKMFLQQCKSFFSKNSYCVNFGDSFLNVGVQTFLCPIHLLNISIQTILKDRTMIATLINDWSYKRQSTMQLELISWKGNLYKTQHACAVEHSSILIHVWCILIIIRIGFVVYFFADSRIALLT